MTARFSAGGESHLGPGRRMLTDAQWAIIGLFVGPLVVAGYILAYRLATGKRLVGEGPLSEAEKGSRSLAFTEAGMIIAFILWWCGLAAAITALVIWGANPGLNLAPVTFTALAIYWAGILLVAGLAPRLLTHWRPVTNRLLARAEGHVQEMRRARLAKARAVLREESPGSSETEGLHEQPKQP